ncbi:hypothetical protein JNO54_04340 [Janibacter sp. YIM B02568]|uniref:hypothetical protein n=1 Tax=Janibacter endophyticus TaxID=2806261 RepID=UPI00194F29F3|nr:hypothetical protein [Janibacter endophyticus]MBM6545371.1 hypothetical protein [Janibacter endophyticus]
MRAVIPRALSPRAPWTAELVDGGRRAATFALKDGSGATYRVRIERCVEGRLADSYPAGAHDIELAPEGPVPAEMILVATDALVEADPLCRRVVLALDPEDIAAHETAQRAGYRPGVEVDIREGTLSLLVYEPAWVTQTDMDLDRVPTD